MYKLVKLLENGWHIMSQGRYGALAFVVVLHSRNVGAELRTSRLVVLWSNGQVGRLCE